MLKNKFIITCFVIFILFSCNTKQNENILKHKFLFAKIEDTSDVGIKSYSKDFTAMDLQLENVHQYELINFNTALLNDKDTFPALVFNKEIQIVIDEQKELSNHEKYWIGNLSERNSVFSLYQVDSVYSGAFFFDHTQYEIKNIDGQYLLLEIQQTGFIDEEEPLNIIEGNNEDDDPSSFIDSNEYVDILVCYSKTARESTGSTSKIKTEIGLAILETNKAYINSNVGHKIRLVGTYELDYKESGMSATDVTWIRNNSIVQSYRERVKADIVIFIVENLSSCGRVYAIQENISKSFSPNAFGVVKEVAQRAIILLVTNLVT